jgi:hypothetical protein
MAHFFVGAISKVYFKVMEQPNPKWLPKPEMERRCKWTLVRTIIGESRPTPKESHQPKGFHDIVLPRPPIIDQNAIICTNMEGSMITGKTRSGPCKRLSKP